MSNEAKQNKEMGGIVGTGTITAEVVVEREFGNGSFFELYSGYVSKKIIELLELEKENAAEVNSEIAQQPDSAKLADEKNRIKS